MTTTRRTPASRTDIGDRVLLTGGHPWVGHTGEVIEKQAATGVVTVRLDSGHECMAWPRQYRRLA